MADAQSHVDNAGPPTWPSPPSYHFETPIRAVASVDGGKERGSFYRSARWTGDGTAVLTTAEDRVLRVHDSVCDESQTSLGEARAFKQPDAVNAATWYPSASRLAPETFCFVTSVKDTPVRLVDAADGRIRASYPIVDHRERFVSPHCLAFNTTAEKLYCGFESAIEVFDVSTPGYDTSERLKLGLTRRERGGQRGIISALSFNPHSPGSYAAGSFAGSVVLYDEDTGSRAAGHVEGIEGGGVTQIAWHPLQAHTFFVGSRRSTAIQVFDTRDTSAPIGSLERSGSTNQRLSFDVDPWGRWLGAGDEHGNVRVWDIAGPSYDVLFDHKLHDDAVNSVQFHAYQPLLLTCAGSRAHLQGPELEFSSDEESSDSDSDSDSHSEVDTRVERQAHIKTGAKDARLMIWSLGEP